MDNNHVIEKMFVEVNTNSVTQGEQLKNNLNVFLKQDVFPQIEAHFKSIENDFSAEIIQISQLSLNINIDRNNNFNEFKRVLKEQIISKIQKKVTQNNFDISDIKPTFINAEEKKINTFFYFLEHGVLPWWGSNTKEVFFNKKEIFKIVKGAGFKIIFRKKTQSKKVLERMIHQFNDEEIQLLFQHSFDAENQKNLLSNEVISKLKKIDNSTRKSIWMQIANYLVKGNKKEFVEQLVRINDEVKNNKKESIEDVKAIIQELIKSEEIAISTSIIENKIEIREELTEFYAANAGLILMHPFLKQFFKRCNLLDKNNEIVNKELAVHLLHYVATEQENQLESNLIFEKILCGVPIEKSINRDVFISDELKKVANELLEGVIQNWDVLKNSSPNLLRHEFLQRQGKLRLKGTNPKIIIERKTYDILLDKLPWNISICKIPWIDTLIYTDW